MSVFASKPVITVESWISWSPGVVPSKCDNSHMKISKFDKSRLKKFVTSRKHRWFQKCDCFEQWPQKPVFPIVYNWPTAKCEINHAWLGIFCSQETEAQFFSKTWNIVWWLENLFKVRSNLHGYVKNIRFKERRKFPCNFCSEDRK